MPPQPRASHHGADWAKRATFTFIVCGCRSGSAQAKFHSRKFFGGGENPADLLTKTLDKNKLLRCLDVFEVKYAPGRAAIAPTVAGADCTVSCVVPALRW